LTSQLLDWDISRQAMGLLRPALVPGVWVEPASYNTGWQADEKLN